MSLRPPLQPSPEPTRRGSALLLTLLIILASCACGSTSQMNQVSNPEPSATPSLTRSTPSAAASSTARYPTLTVSDDGTAGFTSAQVEAAYRAVADYTLNVGWQPVVMRTDATTATLTTFAAVTAMMTTTCAADFNQIATRAAAGSQPDINTVEGITLIGVRSPDTRVLAPGDAAVSGRAVTAASASLDPTDLSRLAITLTATAEVNFVDGTAKSRSLTTRHITYDVVPGMGATPWQIDAWQGTIQSDKAVPES